MDLSKLTSNIPDKDKSFPPVEKWNPDLCPDDAFNIDRDGNWYYQNSIIYVICYTMFVFFTICEYY